MYSEKFLLDRLYTELQNNMTNTKMSLPRPEVSCANKRSFISNFRTICTKLNRPENKVKKYFMEELKTDISISQDGALVITGMYKLNQMTTLISNYINDYVKCKECSSCNTEIVKENRISYMSCNKCLSKKALR